MYVDPDIALKNNFLGKVKVYLNGVIVSSATRAKCGRNGFVEYYGQHLRLNKSKDELLTYKKRGNVKISFNL